MNLNNKKRTSFIFFSSLFGMLMGFHVVADTVTIKNNSDKPIDVIFQAVGCFGISLGRTTVCKSEKNVPPGSSATYKWKWLQSNKTVRVKQDYYMFLLTSKSEGTYSWTGYTGDKGKKEAWRNKDIKPKDSTNFRYAGPTVGIQY